MSVRKPVLVLGHPASKVQRQTRNCKMLALLLVITWNAQFFLLWKMGLLRRLYVGDRGRLSLEVACARSEKMGLVGLVEEDEVVIGEVLQLLHLETGSEAKGFLKVDEVVVAVGGHHTKDITGPIRCNNGVALIAKLHDTHPISMYE